MPWSSLLILTAFVVVSHVGCLGVTSVTLSFLSSLSTWLFFYKNVISSLSACTRR